MDTVRPAVAGAMRLPTVQVHVIGTCNLRCLHCYAESGPDVHVRLGVALLARLFAGVARQGFRRVALSGGEPLLHPALPAIARFARDAGLEVALTTNGTLLHRAEWSEARAHVDEVDVSVDGPPELHNALRGSPTAFCRMERGLGVLRGQGVPFGLVHTVTARSVPHLGWLVDFAEAVGAARLQLRPLGLVGAGRELASDRPDGEQLARTWVESLLRQRRASVRIQIEVFNRELSRRHPEWLHAHGPSADAHSLLAELVNPLVVMCNGDVSPVCHAMPAALRLGNLHRDDLGSMTERWKRGGYALFRQHCQRVWAEVEPTLEWPYFNWVEYLQRAPLRVGT